VGIPQVLDDDEQVVLAVRPHGRVLVGPVLVLLVVAPVTVVMAAYVPGGPVGSVGSVLRWVVLGLGAIVVVRGALVPFLVWRSTSYTVTTHRVSVRRGVLHRFGRDVSLGRVTAVTFRIGPWDRLFGSGRIRIDTAGEGPLVLDDVPAVEQVQRAVQTYAGRAQDDDAADDEAADEDVDPFDDVEDAVDDGAFEEDVDGDDWDDVDVRVADDDGHDDDDDDADDADDDWDGGGVADPGRAEVDDVTWRRRGRSGWGRRR
jgi:uncharacterized membrane protein YdbT with pleckstrin-like domain